VAPNLGIMREEEINLMLYVNANFKKMKFCNTRAKKNLVLNDKKTVKM
jgi:hypothetical protein